MPSTRATVLLLAVLVADARAQTPADRVPVPKPEPCLEFAPELGEEEMATPGGISYAEVKTSLNAVIQAALYCARPEGLAEVHLTFELVVGCDGVVAEIVASDRGGAPEDYVACVSSVIARADFPGHDMADGMPITYPVNVAW